LAGSFTVTAKDALSNVATGYRGTVHFTSSDGSATLPANYTFTAADSGTHMFSATLKTVGTQSLTATDTATTSITGSQTGIVVNTTTLAGNITAKSGPQNARTWTLALLNNGPGVAKGVTIPDFTLTQAFGAACTPIIGNAFPLAVGDLAPLQTGTATVTIDFTGCAASARFTARFTYSANGGAVSGFVVRYNQFE
jgi:hypothetical protein